MHVIPRASDKVGERIYSGGGATRHGNASSMSGSTTLSITALCVRGSQPTAATPCRTATSAVRLRIRLPSAFDMLSALNTGGTTTFSDACRPPALCTLTLDW